MPRRLPVSSSISLASSRRSWSASCSSSRALYSFPSSYSIRSSRLYEGLRFQPGTQSDPHKSFATCVQADSTYWPIETVVMSMISATSLCFLSMITFQKTASIFRFESR